MLKNKSCSCRITPAFAGSKGGKQPNDCCRYAVIVPKPTKPSQQNLTSSRQRLGRSLLALCSCSDRVQGFREALGGRRCGRVADDDTVGRRPDQMERNAGTVTRWREGMYRRSIDGARGEQRSRGRNNVRRSRQQKGARCAVQPRTRTCNCGDSQ